MVSIPLAPSAIDVDRMEAFNDANHRITVTTSTTVDRPVESTLIQRWDNATAKFTTRITLANSAGGIWFDTTTEPHRVYQWRAATKNSAGQSAWAYTPIFSTTPYTPEKPVATRTASGNITITRPTGLPPMAQFWEVMHGLNGVDSGTVLAKLPYTQELYTHMTPGVGNHHYRNRAVSSTPLINSPFSVDSNVVKNQGPPNAPTGLSPHGVSADATEGLSTQWTHNSADTTAQTAYQIQTRVNGGAWALRTKVISGASAAILPANGYGLNGTNNVMEWQVRTWGADTATPSPWSASATVVLSDRPTAAINTPVAVHNSSRVVATWGYYDVQGTPQSGYEAYLYTGLGHLIETRDGNSDRTLAPFSTNLTNGTGYQLAVRVRDGANLWSEWDTLSFTTDFTLPVTPDLPVVSWDAATGSATISYSIAASAAGRVSAVRAAVYRALGTGPFNESDWELVADGLGLSGAVVDPLAHTNTLTAYRVVSEAELGTYAPSASSILATPSGGIYVNAGPGRSEVAALLVDPKINETGGRSRELVRFSGRALPVEVTGAQRSRIFAVSAVLMPDGSTPTRRELIDFPLLDGPAFLRDPDGTRAVVSMGDVSVSGIGTGDPLDLSWTLTEVDGT